MTERSCGRMSGRVAAAARPRLLLLLPVVVLAAAWYLLPSAGSTVPVQAQDPTATPTPYEVLVYLHPASQTVEAGTDVVVEVRVEDVPDIVMDPRTPQIGLGSYGFELAFDPALLSHVDTQDGPFLTSTGRSKTCLGPQVGTGSVEFACATFDPPPDGPIGSGLLATVTLATSCAGTSTLEFADEVALAHVLGNGFPAVGQGADVTVTGPVCATPTASPVPPSPTRTPTTTPTPTPCDGVCATPTDTPAPTLTPTPTATPTGTPLPGETPAPTATGGPPASTNTPAPASTSTPPRAATPTLPGGTLGDTNGDGVVDSVDALLVLWFDVRILPFVPFAAFADVNSDGNTDALDAALILQFDVGLLSALPPP